MPSLDRRAAARRRAWGRGPHILRFEPLEGRQLLSTTAAQAPDPTAAATTPAGAGLGTQTTTPSAVTTLPLPVIPQAAISGPITTATGGDTTTTTADPTTTATTPAPLTGPLSIAPTTSPTVTPALSGPDLVATSFSAPGNLDWGDSFQATGAITNRGGTTTTAPVQVNVYASVTPTLDARSVLVGTVDVPAGLTPGGTAKFNQTLNLPPAPIPGLGLNPSYYLTLQVDPNNAAGEARLDDKQGQGQGVDTAVVTITPHPVPLLIGTGIVVAPTAAAWGGTVTINANVENVGLGAAPATRARVILTPFGQVPSAGDVTIGSLSIPPVSSGQTVAVSQAITLPATPPSPLAGATKFVVSLIEDADHQTSTGLGSAGRGLGLDQAWLQVNPGPTAVPVTLLPDLKVAAVRGPQQLTWGQPFQVAATLQNVGTGDAAPFKVRFLLVDDDVPSLPPLAVLDTVIPGLKAGFAQDLVQTVNFGGKLPAGLTAGATANTHVEVQINPEHALDEVSLGNNTLDSAPIQLRLVGTDGSSVPIPASGPTITPTPAPTPTVSPTPVPLTPIVPATPAAPPATTTTPAPKTVVAHKAQTTPRPKLTKKHHGLRIFPHIFQHSHHPKATKKGGKSY